MTEDTMLIGWREWVGLPEIGIPAVKAKIDTGARTSCIHAYDISPITRDDTLYVQFKVQPIQRRNDIVRSCEAKVVDRRYVTDSGGHHELRYVISTDLEIGGKRWPIEVTLKNRDSMMFRMLLGRTAMEHYLVVDPAKSFQLTRVFPNDIERHYSL